MDERPETTLSSFVASSNYNQGFDGTLEQNCEGFMDLCYYQDDDEYFESIPKGWRFVPTDEELICDYLLPKLEHAILPRNKIHQANIYRHSPEELSELYPSQEEGFWYFFTERERKYGNGRRPNRATKTWDGNDDIGYWKVTGLEKQVTKTTKDDITKKDAIVKVGTRNTLVYYKGKAPKGEKQSWIMHEYLANGHDSKPSNGMDMKLDDCVLCKIYRNTRKESKIDKSNVQAQDQLQPDSAIMQLPMANTFYG